MHTPPGLIGAAALSALVALAAGALLAAAARRRAAPHRQAYALLAVAAAVALLTLLCALVVALSRGGHWPHEPAQEVGWPSVVAVGTAVSGLLFCLGLLRMPGVAGSAGSAARLALDGVIVGTALWFVGWVLFTEPTRLLGDATPTSCPAILIASVSAASSTGLAAIMVFRVSAPRRGLAVLAAGITVATCGGLCLAAGLCQAGPVVTSVSAVALAGGLLIAALAVHRIDPPGQVAIDVIRHDGEYAVIPMAAMVGSAIYHLLQDGRFDALGVVAGSVQGFALVARQYLTLHEARAYARRLAEREAHFRQLAHTDALTGLANRRGLLQALHRCVEAGGPCILLSLDLDGFKHVNDMRGHDVGDAVLAEVGRRLRGNLRPGDLAARLGGDEFAVLMHGGPTEAGAVADRLLGVLGVGYEQPEGAVFLSVSIGLAGWTDMADVELLLRHADLALRYAKQRGKNRIERYDGAYDQLLRRRTTLEHELRGAIERDELRLVFQPVASLPSVRPVGAEALLRWRHPELGNVRPDEFIPLAEECGMISTLGAWVLHQACHQLSRWLAEGHDVWVSVNVSPRELHAPEYVVQVAEALRAHHVPPQRLVLEVTEHAVATDLDELIRRLTALRLTGVRIALDDFGAGYSSLGQLRRLPIDILKIDHGLVAEHEPVRPVGRDGPAFAPMVDIVMRLGHQLGLEVIAEGVTTRTELAAVVAAGCRFGQGALFGWGVPAEHLEAMLEAATSPGARPSRPAPTAAGVPSGQAAAGVSSGQAAAGVSSGQAVAGVPSGPAAGVPSGQPAAGAPSQPVSGERVPGRQPPVQRPGEGVAEQVRPGAGGVPGYATPNPVNQNVGSVDSSHEMRQA